MDKHYYEDLRRFLNRECLWCKYDLCSPYVKMYYASTAISPNFRPTELQELEKTYVLNVSIIFLKPKKQPTYVTVFINEVFIACCVPDFISIKAVPGEHDMFLMYLGPFYKPPSDTKIPALIKIEAFEDGIIPLKSDIWKTSSLVSTKQLQTEFKSWTFTTIGKCVWYGRGSLFQFFLSMEYMVCCPQFKEFPSFGRLVNLVTRCDDKNCVPCYGLKVHVNVKGGYTPPFYNGDSISCPCVLSCAALKSDIVPITGHRNILTLFFGPEVHNEIISLKFKPSKRPIEITDLCVGITGDGQEVQIDEKAWQLLRMSDFFTRACIYGCQILKRRCLNEI
ncbi:ORF33 [Felid gammaherpesvirus 1]|uniref:ORF33 n=1 Tax=Felid gammaherpesvirus 1 TaxID=2560468 RepID=A0A0M4MS49_9GAMA|nr:ORF33 [Felis catus gammaherpesvirus 1]ALE14745.1 ORF33 [Felis catus gammaherpesvirus 1]